MPLNKGLHQAVLVVRKGIGEGDEGDDGVYVGESGECMGIKVRKEGVTRTISQTLSRKV